MNSIPLPGGMLAFHCTTVFGQFMQPPAQPGDGAFYLPKGQSVQIVGCCGHANCYGFTCLRNVRYTIPGSTTIFHNFVQSNQTFHRNNKNGDLLCWRKVGMSSFVICTIPLSGGQCLQLQSLKMARLPGLIKFEVKHRTFTI